MVAKIHITDGGKQGTGRKAGVTSDNALPVTQVPRLANDQTDEQLTRIKYFSGLFVRDDGSGSTDLRVDGSVTPVDFVIAPPPGEMIQLREIRYIFEDSSLDMGGNDVRRFGSAAGTGGLVNGLESFIEQGAGVQNLFVEPINHMSEFFWYVSDFFNIPNATANNVDLLTWIIDLKLLVPILVVSSNTDRVVVRINDDLTAMTDKFQVLAIGQREPFK